MPGLSVPHHIPKFAQVHVHCISDAIQPSHPLSSPSPPAFNPPSSRVFYSELTLHIRWPKYSSFSCSISPSNEYSGLISFRTDWLHILAFQGTRKSLLQHHSSKASTIRHSLLYCSSLTTIHDHWEDHSLDYMDLCQQNNVSAFQHTVYICHSFPAKKQTSSDFKAAVMMISPSSVILEPKNRRSVTISTFPPSIWHEIMGPDDILFVLFIFSFKPALSLSSFTLIQRLFSFSSLSAINVVSSAYLRLLMFLSPILIPAYDSSSPAFLMMYSV